MDYYIASEQGPLGPYSIEQLKERPIKAGDMVWCKGMTEWTRADEVHEIVAILNAPAVPPVFDRRRFDLDNAAPAANTTYRTQSTPVYRYDDGEVCPPTYRWLAIIAFLGIIPCAIVALIKSVMVTRLWEEGNREGARYQSRKAFLWGMIGAVVGIPLSIYMLFFTDEMSMDLLNQFM